MTRIDALNISVELWKVPLFAIVIVLAMVGLLIAAYLMSEWRR